VYRQASKPYIHGITLSGGDPLYQSEESLMYLSNFVKKFKNDFPDKDIWLYTGFTIPDIFGGDDMLSVYRQMVLEYVDYVVDGKFEIAKKDCGLAFRGSSNQNIWKLPERVIVKDEVFQN
jgi:anaerobic ribonucleoside-triphosphate reductase activating protein